jgi:glucose/arabinose dehydrogenase
LVTALNAARAQPYGLTARDANTTLQMPQNPPVYGYTLTNAYTGFANLIMAASPPNDTNRLFVVERFGRITVITNLALNNFARPVFLNITNRVATDVERGLLGLEFHPGYASNGWFYVFYCYTNYAQSNSGAFNRLSRFQVSATNANVADASSEVILFNQLDEAGNHNAGDIHFGPDGYLYVALGDEGDQLDIHANSQRIDQDFFSGILRLDVDQRATNLPPNPHAALMGQTNYFVPADNPFVGATQFNGSNVNPASVRSEFWAVGLRNPWRMSFDPPTGTLYCGDVGMVRREEVNVIVKGGNYGWVWREGTLPGPTANQGPAGFTSLPPILEYDRGTGTNQGNCIIGGIVYRGNRISQLTGKYVFSDFVSANVWALTPNGTNVATFERITGAPAISSFAVDPRNGDVLLVSHGGFIQRLIYNTNLTSGAVLPPTLAETGAFSDAGALTPNAGIVPYEINVPFWSDNARKRRWFSVPDTNQTIGFSREGNWLFPTGTVWIKHFDLELTNGAPASAKRIETRLIVRNSDGVYGVTYRWGNSLTNAALVPEEGLDESFVINDGGTTRTQVWHYPSRSQCLSCHTAVAGFALGFNTAQMNCDFDYAGTIDNQIRALDHVGYFSPRPASLHTLRALAHATNAAYSLEYRVRSYLAANCQQCHQPGGTALGLWDARIENSLPLAGLVNGTLLNNLGDPGNRVVAPADPVHSVLLTRISENGALRMPPLASNLLDTNAIGLVTGWINSLINYQTFSQWQVAHFGSTNAPLTGAPEDFDGDGSVNLAEYLLGTDPTLASSLWQIGLTTAAGTAQVRFEQMANRGFEVQFATNLQPPVLWTPLDVPANRPFISSSNFSAVVPDPLTDGSRFYRVRVFEP